MVSGLAMPAAMLLFGPLGDVVALEWLMIGTGALLIAGGVVLGGRRELLAIGIAPPVSAEDAE